jgi:hypothetical protein
MLRVCSGCVFLTQSTFSYKCVCLRTHVDVFAVMMITASSVTRYTVLTVNAPSCQEALSRLRTRSRFLLSRHKVVVSPTTSCVAHVCRPKKNCFKIPFCARQINMQRYLSSSRRARVSGHAHTCTHIKCAVCKFIYPSSRPSARPVRHRWVRGRLSNVLDCLLHARPTLLSSSAYTHSILYRPTVRESDHPHICAAARSVAVPWALFTTMAA